MDSGRTIVELYTAIALPSRIMASESIATQQFIGGHPREVVA
jgi:hypothetical protein